MVVKPGTLDELPIGHHGEIVIRSQYCALGYWRDSERTQRSFRNLGDGISVFQTGDFGRFLVDGTLESLGREDGQIKRLGRKVNLLELEIELNQFPEINEACIIFIEHEGVGHLFAFVSSSPKFDQSLLEDFGEGPQGLEVISIEKLPTLAGGKFDRRRLQEIAKAHIITQFSTSPVPPVTKTEQRVAEIWRSILAVETVGRETDFFQQGGDSLAMIDCLTRVAKEFEKSIQKTLLLKHSKLVEFARAVDVQPISTNSNCIEQIREGSLDDVHVLFIGMSLAHLALPCLSKEYSISVFHVDGYQTTSFRGLTINEIVDEAIGELRFAETSVPTTIVGFSYGGLVAYALAERIGRVMSVFPTAMIIEPSTPLPSNRFAILKEKFREWRRRFQPGEQHRFSFQKIQMKEKSGEQMSNEERWELVRPTIRRNRRLCSPGSYSGDILLVGRPKQLKRGKLWHQLAEKHIQVIGLLEAKNHLALLEPDAVKVWTTELQAYISQNNPTQ